MIRRSKRISRKNEVACFELIGEVRLRNHYRVIKDGDDYLVEEFGRHGESHCQPVLATVVEWVHESLGGETVTANDAEQAIKRNEDLRLPYHGGHKLHFYAQAVLIILVACGHATFQKVGNAFEYTIARSPV